MDFLSSIENESSSYILLNPTISAPVVDINIPIRISFDDAGVLSHTIEVEGLIATPVSEGAMEYDIVSTEEYGVFTLYATYEDNVTVKSSVYTYSDGNTVYLSEVSKENAFENDMSVKIINKAKCGCIWLFIVYL